MASASAPNHRSRRRSIALLAGLFALIAILPVIVAVGLWSLGVGSGVSLRAWLFGLGLVAAGVLLVAVVFLGRRLRPPA